MIIIINASPRRLENIQLRLAQQIQTLKFLLQGSPPQDRSHIVYSGNFVAIKEYFLKDLNSDTLAFIKSQASAAEAVKGDYIIKHIKTFWFPEFIYMIWELC